MATIQKRSLPFASVNFLRTWFKKADGEDYARLFTNVVSPVPVPCDLVFVRHLAATTTTKALAINCKHFAINWVFITTMIQRLILTTD